VISPSSLSGFGWLSSVRLPVALNNAAATEANDQAVAAESFQSILAQAVMPETPRSDSLPQAAPPHSVEGADTETDAQRQEVALNGKTPARTEFKDKTSPSASQAVVRNDKKSNGRTSPRLDSAEKPQKASHATQTHAAQTDDRVKKAIATNEGTDQTLQTQSPTAPDSADSAASSASDKTSPANSASQPGRLPPAAAAALGGLKSLSGAAFAMHITPTANPSNVSSALAAPSSEQPDSAVNQSNDKAGSPDLADSLPPVTLPTISGSQPQPSETANAGTPPIGLPVPPLMLNAPMPTADTAAASGEPAPISLEPVEIASENTDGLAQPVRTVQLQLAGEGAGRVDLRLVEHAGGLSLSVRATDTVLTRGLQDNLPELSARLAAERYQTHTFLPSVGEASGGAFLGSSDQPSGQAQQESGGRAFSQGGSGYGGDGGRQQAGQQGGQHSGQDAGQEGGQSEEPSAWLRHLTTLTSLSSSFLSTSAPGSQTDPAASPVTSP
jgi:hypothetical protein